MHILTWLAHFFSAVGAINWGLTAFFKFNVVEFVTDMVKIDYFKEAIYGIVAFSGFYALVSLFM